MKKLLFAIFIMCVTAVGCEIPYTGPMLTVDDVDRYLHRVDADTVCLQDGFDSICVKVIPGPRGERGPRGEPGKPGANAPIIHIHEKSIIYEFYYEGKIIFRAEKEMHTTEVLAQLAAEEQAELERRIRLGLPQEGNTNNGGNNGGTNNGGTNNDGTNNDGTNNGGTNNDGTNNGGNPPPPANPGPVDTHRVFPVNERNPDGTFPEDSRVGWIVNIYYQDPIPPVENRGFTLGASGFTVRVYVDNVRHPDIRDDTQVVQTAGGTPQNPDYSVQFFVSTRAYEGQTVSSEIRIEVDGLFPNHTATFTITDGVGDISSNIGDPTFQLTPLNP